MNTIAAGEIYGPLGVCTITREGDTFLITYEPYRRGGKVQTWTEATLAAARQRANNIVKGL